MTKGRIIQRGAEAVLYLDPDGSLMKERVKKGYRIPELDEAIRRQRARLEVRLLEKARRSGVNTPMASLTDKYNIRMEHIDGDRVKDVLGGMGRQGQDETAAKIGSFVAVLHGSDIVHGEISAWARSRRRWRTRPWTCSSCGRPCARPISGFRAGSGKTL
jgi:TP53 regulating kinase-like protein